MAKKPLNKKTTFYPVCFMVLVLLTLSLACSSSGSSGGNSRQADDDTMSDDDLAPTDDDTTPTDDDTTPDDDTTDDDAIDDDSGELTWVSTPAGTFWMGCVPEDSDCFDDEKPQHQVTLPAFQITRSDITQAQYENVTGRNPSYYQEATGYPPCPNCPVEMVTWFDADFFCQAIGGRLPTEAEWEYAARAGTDTIYLCGDDPSCLDSIAWYGEGAAGTTDPVCQKKPNAWGLCDMTGNVFQWVNDWYDANYYSVSPSNNPPGPTTGEFRVYRGGSGFNDLSCLRASRRFSDTVNFRSPDQGFRCARD